MTNKIFLSAVFFTIESVTAHTFTSEPRFELLWSFWEEEDFGKSENVKVLVKTIQAKADRVMRNVIKEGTLHLTHLTLKYHLMKR